MLTGVRLWRSGTFEQNVQQQQSQQTKVDIDLASSAFLPIAPIPPLPPLIPTSILPSSNPTIVNHRSAPVESDELKFSR